MMRSRDFDQAMVAQGDQLAIGACVVATYRALVASSPSNLQQVAEVKTQSLTCRLTFSNLLLCCQCNVQPV